MNTRSYENTFHHQHPRPPQHNRQLPRSASTSSVPSSSSARDPSTHNITQSVNDQHRQDQRRLLLKVGHQTLVSSLSSAAASQKNPKNIVTRTTSEHIVSSAATPEVKHNDALRNSHHRLSANKRFECRNNTSAILAEGEVKQSEYQQQLTKRVTKSNLVHLSGRLDRSSSPVVASCGSGTVGNRRVSQSRSSCHQHQHHQQQKRNTNDKSSKTKKVNETLIATSACIKSSESVSHQQQTANSISKQTNSNLSCHQQKNELSGIADEISAAHISTQRTSRQNTTRGSSVSRPHLSSPPHSFDYKIKTPSSSFDALVPASVNPIACSHKRDELDAQHLSHINTDRQQLAKVTKNASQPIDTTTSKSVTGSSTLVVNDDSRHTNSLSSVDTVASLFNAGVVKLRDVPGRRLAVKKEETSSSQTTYFDSIQFYWNSLLKIIRSDMNSEDKLVAIKLSRDKRLLSSEDGGGDGSASLFDWSVFSSSSTPASSLGAGTTAKAAATNAVNISTNNSTTGDDDCFHVDSEHQRQRTSQRIKEWIDSGYMSNCDIPPRLLDSCSSVVLSVSETNSASDNISDRKIVELEDDEHKAIGSQENDVNDMEESPADEDDSTVAARRRKNGVAGAGGRRGTLVDMSRKYMSFDSDISALSYDSIGSLIEQRRQNPEELLTALGFGHSAADGNALERIPERFFNQQSQAKGIDVEQFVQSFGIVDNYSTDTSHADWVECFDDKFYLLERFVNNNAACAATGLDRNNNSATNNSFGSGGNIDSFGGDISGGNAGGGGTTQGNDNTTETTANEIRRRISASKEPFYRNSLLTADSILNPTNREFLDNQGKCDEPPVTKRLVLGTRTYSFDAYGDPCVPPKSPIPSPNYSQHENVNAVLLKAADALLRGSTSTSAYNNNYTRENSPTNTIVPTVNSSAVSPNSTITGSPRLPLPTNSSTSFDYHGGGGSGGNTSSDSQSSSATRLSANRETNCTNCSGPIIKVTNSDNDHESATSIDGQEEDEEEDRRSFVQLRQHYCDLIKNSTTTNQVINSTKPQTTINRQFKETSTQTDNELFASYQFDQQSSLINVALNSLRLSLQIYRNHLLHLQLIRTNDVNVNDDNVENELSNICERIDDKLSQIELLIDAGDQNFMLSNNQSSDADVDQNGDTAIIEHIKIINELINNAAHQLHQRRIDHLNKS